MRSLDRLVRKSVVTTWSVTHVMLSRRSTQVISPRATERVRQFIPMFVWLHTDLFKKNLAT